MEKIPSLQANRFASSQDSLNFMEPDSSLQHSQVPAPVLKLSHIDPIHNSTSHFLKFYLNIILKFTPGSPQ